MVSVFAAAWRVILKRTRADWLILAAAMLITLLATTLLSAGPIYAGAVTLSGLHRTLHDSPITEANVEISARVRNEDVRPFDERVAAQVRQSFAPAPGPVARTGRSDSFALPDQPPDDVRNLAVFAFFENVEAHATLLAGAWPTPAGGPVESVISESAASLLGLAVGSEVELTSRREPDFAVTTRVVGIYRVNDPLDPYWWEEPLDIEGIEVGESFTTFGPFVTTPDDFFNRTTIVSSDVMWRVYPVFTDLTVSEVPTLRGNIESIDDQLNAPYGASERFNTDTRLDTILRAAERSLLVTRTGVMILTVQLAILAGYALVLTAGLLVEQRRVETALLRSRGASNGQVAAMALMEGLLIAIPAAVAGPWVAAVSLRLLNVTGPLAAIDLTVDPRVTTSAYLLSIVSAVACVVALVVPAFLAARSFIDARAARGRQQARGVAQRAGIDLALLAVAAIGYWQLRRYGAPITESVQGRLGLDPLLVAAPALGLLAGAVVALRVIPLLSRFMDRAAAGTQRVVPALGAWQMSRRPLRYTRSALLLMLALAIGLFAVSYTRTWTSSQSDQADYQVGSDLRVTPDRRFGRAIPPYNLASAYAMIDGIESGIPVIRETTTISRSAGTGAVLRIDAANAADIIQFRPDLAESSLSTLLDELVERRPVATTIPVTGEPRRIALDVRLTLDPVDDVPPDQLSPITPHATVVVRDARGLYYRLPAGNLATDGSDQRLILDLTHDIDGSPAAPEFPLAVAAVEMRLIIPAGVARTGRLDVLAVESSSATQGDDWQPMSLDPGAGGWQLSTNQISGVFESPSIAPANGAASVLSYQFSTGSVDNDALLPLVFSSRPAPAGAPGVVAPLAVLVSDQFLVETQSAIGDDIQLELGGQRRDALISGSFSAFPTLDPENAPIIVVDLPTVATLQFESASRVDDIDEWWLAADDARTDEIVTSLRATPYSSWRVLDRFERAETLRSDPVALGIIGALALGFVSAALFAAIGFVVSASVSARERLGEFALLRALGLSPRQLSGWLSLENGLLVAISLVCGTVLGLLISWLVLPFVTLTQDASEVVPGVIVSVPWGTVLVLELVTIAALAVVVLALGLLLRRVGLGTVLRMGED